MFFQTFYLPTYDFVGDPPGAATQNPTNATSTNTARSVPTLCGPSERQGRGLLHQRVVFTNNLIST